MQLWIQDDKGNLLGSYVQGKLRVNTLFDRDLLAFSLFSLMTQLMQAGNGGASYGGPLVADTQTDFGQADEDVTA